jgi:hypothetical protein
VASEEGKRRWLDQGFPREVTSAGRSIHPSIPCVVVVPSAACHATTVTGDHKSVCVDRRPRAPLPPPSLVVVRPASSPPAPSGSEKIWGLLGCGHRPPRHRRPRHGTVFSVVGKTAGKTAAAACDEPRCGVAKCGRGTNIPLAFNSSFLHARLSCSLLIDADKCMS